MKQLLLMDSHNYDESLPEIRRTAVRGIASVNGKILFVEDKFGVLKLPGGGQDEGETDEETLIREVREETGYNVIPESIRPFGSIEEKRLSTREEMIWHQYNNIYFCEVDPVPGECDYSEAEKAISMHLHPCTIEEAFEINEQILAREGRQAWNQREYNTLRLIKEAGGFASKEERRMKNE
ncbi:MAG: NUDIX domain-containing protein [Ruminococcus sp.]|nr:NUDIX domain-containing protein [Ruminococcus sp.]